MTLSTINPSSALNYKANKDQEIRSDNVHVGDVNPNMLDYFRSSMTREAGGRASQVLMQIIHSEFSDFFFQGLGVLKEHLDYRYRRAADHTKHLPGGYHMHSRYHSGRSWTNYRSSK